MVRQELQSLQQAEHSKIDKQLVKSVVLSYLSAPSDQKPEAERLLARILDLDPAVPRFWHRVPAADPSLAAQFVQFLHSESAAPPGSAAMSSTSQPVRQLAHSLLLADTRRSQPPPPGPQ